MTTSLVAAEEHSHKCLCVHVFVFFNICATHMLADSKVEVSLHVRPKHNVQANIHTYSLLYICIVYCLGITVLITIHTLECKYLHSDRYRQAKEAELNYFYIAATYFLSDVTMFCTVIYACE